MMPPKTLGTPKEVADRLHRSEGTLANWRSQGTGPPYIKPEGGPILYRWTDVEKWLATQTVHPGAEARS